MSSSLTASMQARRHPETTRIDRLATADMLAMLHQDDKQISEAVGACLPDIARLIDIATATISREAHGHYWRRRFGPDGH